MTRMSTHARALALAAGLGIAAPAGAQAEAQTGIQAGTQAQTQAGPPPEAPLETYSRINLFGFGVYNDLSQPQRDLNLLAIPRHQEQFELRPDFSLSWRALDLGIKPRLVWMHSATEAGVFGVYDRTDSAHHGFINEAYARYRLADKLTLVAARENLQWGPAALLSASNPFNPNNGKGNPNVELPGMDYLRVVAVPGPAWTLSLIANTGTGRFGKDEAFGPTTNTGVLGVAASIIGLASRAIDVVTGKPLPADQFQKTYAAKLDYTGEGWYASAIASHREHDASRFGAFGGWNASEALLVYAEGSVAGAAPGSRDQPRDSRLLAGGSYTLESGQTITAEYFHNNLGCLRVPVLLCADTARVQPQLPLLRRRYALLQLVDTKMRGNINLVARAIRDIDDGSSQATVNIEYELGEHWQLYLTPTLSRGDVGTEFGTLPRRALFFGASYTF